jgi:NADH-quinone oxidoreductase subunit D
MIRSFIDVRLPKAINDVEALCNRNRIFVDRLQGVGALTKAEALQWSVTGPCARAAGVRRDVRKDEPYLCYADNWDGQGAEKVKFSIAVASEGCSLSRYLVRLEEIRQSARIIDQLIDNLPGGSINAVADGKISVPEKGEVYGSIEGVIQLFELFMHNRGFDTPVAETYGSIESPNGELGFYIVADGTKYPFRARTRPPCLTNYQLFPKLIEGHQLADIVAVLGSLNIIAAELDR